MSPGRYWLLLLGSAALAQSAGAVPPPPATPPPAAPTPAAEEPDAELIEFLGSDDHHGDADWAEMLKRAQGGSPSQAPATSQPPPPRPPPSPPPQDAQR
ncbi:MAG TPA: hypothetical protein VKT22_13190 [Steroidobacteraceae bacterium]|nr:hypothetical protein [Steroidobacteraceae bacterium]